MNQHAEATPAILGGSGRNAVGGSMADVLTRSARRPAIWILTPPWVAPVSVIFDRDSLFVSLIRSTPKWRELQANPFSTCMLSPGTGGRSSRSEGWVRMVVDSHEISRLLPVVFPLGFGIQINQRWSNAGLVHPWRPQRFPAGESVEGGQTWKYRCQSPS